jgi:hypothetical protein
VLKQVGDKKAWKNSCLELAYRRGRGKHKRYRWGERERQHKAEVHTEASILCS